MLDEVWLRARRTIVHRLEHEGLWPDRATYTTFARQQHRQGEQLSRLLLKGVLGPDYAFLRSEAVFGASNDRLQARLPYALSFGFELGWALGRLAANGRRGRGKLHVAPISAAFNLGVSLFDLIADNLPELFARFSEQFDERILHGLLVHYAESENVESRICDLPDPELRILMRLIVWILREIGRAPHRNGNDGDALLNPLVKAYRAEIASQQMLDRCLQERLAIARDKSTMPFVVIGTLALANSDNQRNADPRRIEDLVTQLAGCFWLVDDLSDLVRDLRAGSVNAVLLRAGQFDNDTYAVTSRLLEGCYIQEAVDDLCRHVNGVRELLQSARYQQSTATRLLGCCTGYLRDWIT